ncbi:protein kinase [Nonomuraea sp. NPDC047529]|uniref:serine/threonine-protein kinase n=1 Tax=Nonomuraea sp. NPDC047529 TaxID=3155623 RepID=UPI0033CD22D4
MVTPLTPDDPASLGDFRLAGRLGEGGQGVVYLAHSPAGEQVAVKLLNAGDQETRARLARELDALESIASFCTARVLDVSTRGSRPYVVSEFVDGPSLAERVAGRGPLRGGELERLAVGTATALAAIHAAGVVHRDFKPSNVLLGPDGPRVVDFGIARAEGAATHTSGLIGTPAYLSPEQIAGSPASAASDVFAWAATIVHAATGVSPFGADTVPAVLHRVLHAEPDLSPLPSRLRGLIAAALAKDPARRPTAGALMLALVAPGTPPLPASGPASGAPTGPASGPASGAPTGPASGPASGPAPGSPAGTASGGPPGGPHGLGPGVADTRESREGRNRGRGALAGAVAVVVALAVVGGVVLLTARAPGSTATRSTSPPSATAAPSDSPSDPPSTTAAPETPVAARTATARTTGGTGALKIPAAFAGTWTGHTDTTNPLDPDGADNTVELKAGRPEAAWQEKDSQVDCTATITLTEVRPDRLTFSLGATTGGCIPGTVWLELKGDTLTYTWRDVPGLGMVTQTGDLGKK